MPALPPPLWRRPCIDDDIVGSIIKFADDTKLFSKIQGEDDFACLQNDLATVYKWSEDWQMLFNVDKCKVLHIGRSNPSSSYSMGGKLLQAIDDEKDLGVTIHKSLKPSKHVSEIVKKANKTLGILSRTLIFKEREILLPLYKSLVRPVLEYCSPVWNPHL